MGGKRRLSSKDDEKLVLPSLLVAKPSAHVPLSGPEPGTMDVDGVVVDMNLYNLLITNKKKKVIKELSVVDQFVNNLMKDGKKELAR